MPAVEVDLPQLPRRLHQRADEHVVVEQDLGKQRQEPEGAVRRHVAPLGPELALRAQEGHAQQQLAESGREAEERREGGEAVHDADDLREARLPEDEIEPEVDGEQFGQRHLH